MDNRGTNSLQREVSNFTTPVYERLAKYFEGTWNGGRSSLNSTYLEDIAQAIEGRSAVLWVGTGASMSAGAPSWLELIEKLTEKVPKENITENDEEWVRERLKERSLIQLADYLEVALGSNLHAAIKEIFRGLQPQSIHREIARIPIDLILTTNFDHLIEDVFLNKPRVFTPETPYLFLQELKAATREKRLDSFTTDLPMLLKLHGSIGESETLVLSSSGYRDIQHKRGRLRTLLKQLLLMRQFLFVGTSLTDPHLLGLLDEVSGDYRLNQLGPHYAILGSSEANPARVEMLERLYNIRALIYQDEIPKELGEDVPGEKKDKALSIQELMKDNKWTEGRKFRYMPRNRLKSTGVKYILNLIGGRVGKMIAEKRSNQFSLDETFSQAKAFREVLKDAVLTSGSFRGDICLVHRDKKKNSDILVFRHYSGMTDARVAHTAKKRIESQYEVSFDSVCGRAFYLCSSEEVLYVPNVDAIRDIYYEAGDDNTEKKIPLQDDQLIHQYGQLKYRTAHSEVKSEMAIPIISQGVRIGVLNLESRQLNAYSQGHFEVIRKFAKTLDAVHIIASALHDKSRSFARFDRQPEEFKEIVRLFTLMPEIQFIAYSVDYIDGYLKGIVFSEEVAGQTEPEQTAGRISTKAGDISFDLDSTESSLALNTLRAKSDLFFDDAEEAASEGKIDQQNRQALGATGPIFGLRVLAGEVPVGVFVCWYPKKKLAELRCSKNKATLQPFSMSFQNLVFRFLRALSTANKSRLRSVAYLLSHGPGNKSRPVLEKEGFKVADWADRYHKMLFPRRESASNAMNSDFLSIGQMTKCDELLQFCQRVLEATLKALHEVSLFRRIRFYLVDRITSPRELSSVSLVLSYSVHFREKPGTEIVLQREVQHENSNDLRTRNTKDDSYYRFLLERSKHDPFARVQPDIFDDDERQGILGKEKGRYWLAAPIVSLEQELGKSQNVNSEVLLSPTIDNQAKSQMESKDVTGRFYGYVVLDDHLCKESEIERAWAYPNDNNFSVTRDSSKVKVLDGLGRENLTEIQTIYCPTVLDYATGLMAVALEGFATNHSTWTELLNEIEPFRTISRTEIRTD